MIVILILLLCLSSLSLTGRAQNDFLRQFEGILGSSGMGFNHLPPGLSLFSSDFAKDFIDENSLNRVVTMLQGHIKQWSFIEAQLLEPNVNLGMPEILIPLKHLTSAYELLANVFYMQDKISSAKDCLENVCPLIELLPGNIGHDGLKYAEEGCFSLLREIYRELMERRIDPSIDSNEDHGQNNIRRRIGIGVHDHREHDAAMNVDEDNNEFGLMIRGSSRNLPENFNIEERIEELRAPFDHLRSELHHNHGSPLRSLDSPLLSRNDVPVLVFEDGHIRGEMLDFKELEFGAILNDAFLDTGTGSDYSRLSKSPDFKFNDDIESLIRRFVYENEGGRIHVLAETRKLIDSIRSRMIAEGMERDTISYQLRIGDVVGDVMKQAIKQGLSFVGDEIYNHGMALGSMDANIYEYNRIFSEAWPSSDYTYTDSKTETIDQMRLFVLEAFDQVLESGEIGIGTGSSSWSDGGSDEKRYASADGSHHTNKLSRREKRKQLEGIGNGDLLETPESAGILKQSYNPTANSERYSAWNIFFILVCASLPIIAYLAYRDFHRRFLILQSRSSSHRVRVPAGQVTSHHAKDMAANNKKAAMKSLIIETLYSYAYSNPILDNFHPASTSELQPNTSSISNATYKSSKRQNSNHTVNKHKSLSSPGRQSQTQTSLDISSTNGTNMHMSSPPSSPRQPAVLTINHVMTVIIEFLASVTASWLSTPPQPYLERNVSSGTDTSSSSEPSLKLPSVANLKSSSDDVMRLPTPSLSTSSSISDTLIIQHHSLVADVSDSVSDSTDNQSDHSDTGKNGTTKANSPTNSASLMHDDETQSNQRDEKRLKKAKKATEKPSLDEDMYRIIAEVKAAAEEADESSGEWINVATPHARSSHASFNQPSSSNSYLGHKKSSVSLTAKSSNGNLLPPATKPEKPAIATAATTRAIATKPIIATNVPVPVTASNTSTSTAKPSHVRPPKPSKALASPATHPHTSSLPLDAFPPLSSNSTKSTAASTSLQRTNLSRSPSNASIDRPSSSYVSTPESSSNRQSSSYASAAMSNADQISAFPSLDLNQTQYSAMSMSFHPSSSYQSSDTMFYHDDYLNQNSTSYLSSSILPSTSHNLVNNHHSSHYGYSMTDSLLSSSTTMSDSLDRFAPVSFPIDDHPPHLYDDLTTDNTSNATSQLWSFNQLFTSQLSNPTQSSITSPSTYHTSYLSSSMTQHPTSNAYLTSTSYELTSSSLSAASNDFGSLSIEDITGQSPIFSLSAAAPSFTPQSKYSSSAAPSIEVTPYDTNSMSFGDMAMFENDINALSSLSYLAESFADQVDPIVASNPPSAPTPSASRTVTLLCSCSLLPAARIKMVKVVVDGINTVTMRRMVANNDMWRAVVSLPWNASGMTYKYVAQDLDNICYEDAVESSRYVDLLAPKYLSLHRVDHEEDIEIDDEFDRGQVVSAEAHVGDGLHM